MVGTVFVDPSRLDEGSFQDAVAFTGYFRCTGCQEPGPWRFSTESKVELLALLDRGRPGDEDSPVQLGRLLLFDGTPIRYATDGEAHLKRLIAAEPENTYLWNRLGNLYHGGGRDDLARPAFEKSLELDGSDLEALHSLGSILFEGGEWDRSAHLFHQVLKLAWKRKDLRRELLRGIVRNALENLFTINARTDGKTQVFPPPDPEELREPGEQLDLVLKTLDLSLDSSWDELVSVVLRERWAGFNRSTIPRWRRRSSFEAPVPSGPTRNGACPCGSGSKYKNCCGR
jgi:hypothetical protein